MAGENNFNFVHIIKENCLMNCNTFYEDQCCTSCFKSEGTKNTECPSYNTENVLLTNGRGIFKKKKTTQGDVETAK